MISQKSWFCSAFVALALTSSIADAGVDSASATATSSVTILQPISIASSGTLSFGTIVRPSVASAATTTFTVNASTAARTQSGGDAVVVNSSAAASVPTFTISGEGGQSISVNVPASFTLTSGANTLTVTTSNNMSGQASNQTIGGSLGSTGTLAVKVGGSVPIAYNTASGAYAGSITVTASYN